VRQRVRWPARGSDEHAEDLLRTPALARFQLVKLLFQPGDLRKPFCAHACPRAPADPRVLDELIPSALHTVGQTTITVPWPLAKAQVNQGIEYSSGTSSATSVSRPSQRPH
jgi:hypothetical protein